MDTALTDSALRNISVTSAALIFNPTLFTYIGRKNSKQLLNTCNHVQSNTMFFVKKR